MSRFHQTVIPKFIQGNIEDVPVDLIEKALNEHDTRFNKAKDEANAFESLVKDLENIKYDNPDVNTALNKYSSDFEAISKGIQGDITNYQSYLPKINELRRNLDKDLKRGVLGKASENLKQRSDIVKGFETSGASSRRVQGLTNYLNTNYQERGGLNYQDPNTYNRFQEDGQEIRAYKDFDEASYLNNLQARFTKDGTSYSSAGPGGGYLYIKSGHTTFIKEKDVKSHMASYIADSEWEDTNRQDIFLEGYNDSNLRGKELDNYVETELEKRKENFTNTAVQQIAFKNKERANSSVSVDGKVMNDLNYKRQQEKYNNNTIVKEDVSRMSTTEKVAYEQALSIMEGSNSTKTVIDPKTVLGLYKKDPDNFMSNFQNSQWYQALSKEDRGKLNLGAVVNSYKKQGVLSNNLIPLPKGATSYDQLTPEQQMKHIDKENTLKSEIIHTTLSQDATYTLGSDNETTLAGEGSIHNLVTNGVIKINKLNGGTMEVPVMVPARDKDGNYLLKNGQPVPNSTLSSVSQFLGYSEKHDLDLKMEPVTNIQEYFNNDANLNSAKVEKYTDTSGESVFETTVPILYINPETGARESIDLIIKKDTKDYNVDGKNL